ncbi:hypothetical protein [Maritimibacter sp. DP1N21-5]|uniref:hypothetical protein n=1 Tax=Maritimibacter sp. DP1N21-5 TaxID=2836867 RepID=UPI001C48753F|nr:hypothetical protein [Maritimibacter sp. DP1N21-5]MBV7408299.1 hypothetical protein [Maritimibacter sp. DP1N21-5]
MTRKITITARYPRDADTVFAEALQFSEMTEAMRGIAAYHGLPDDVVREGETYVVDITLFGVLKNPGHTMYVETLDRQSRVIQSCEHNSQVTRWDHNLSIQPHGKGCVWTDTVVIEAPKMEWFTARFAAYVYTRRHKHRGAEALQTLVTRL